MRTKQWIVTVAFAGTIIIGDVSSPLAALSRQLLQRAPDAAIFVATAQRKGYVNVIVQFEPPVPASEIRSDAASIAYVKARVAALQNAIIAAHFGSSTNPREGQGFRRGISRLEITPAFSVNVNLTELEALAADPRVKWITSNRPMPPSLIQTVGGTLIGMPNAYTLGATGHGEVVAVLDTGVQANHKFLSGKVVGQACFSNDNGEAGGITLCPDGSPQQTTGNAADATTPQCINAAGNLCYHGTHVAGIAAGFNTSGNTGEPTNGVAKSANIFAVQVFTRFNTQTDCDPNNQGKAVPCVLSFPMDQARALDHIHANANIGGNTVAAVNISIGGDPTSTACDSEVQKPGIDNLRSAGILTAIAAGNDGSPTTISSPACISTAVAVGSSTKADGISCFSNMSNLISLLAPGGLHAAQIAGCTSGSDANDVLSSLPPPYPSFAYLSGTSMATPHVAGAIAAIRSNVPNADADQILLALKITGIQIADTRSGGTVSKPRIQVDKAVKYFGSPCKWITNVSECFTEFPVPTGNSYLWDITAGPDGALWFTETGSSKIGRITTTGVITEFPIPTAGALPAGITSGPDGALWFTDELGRIGRSTISGVITEFPMPLPPDELFSITSGSDGALWFNTATSGIIGRSTTAGVITQFPPPRPDSWLYDITSGPDGALWLTDLTNKIVRSTTAGVITVFPMPTADRSPISITSGPDGALWFTEQGYQPKIGRITAAGVITEFSSSTLNSPQGITAGPDGALWFTDVGANKIGRITTAGVITEFLVPTPGSQPNNITVGPDGALWFTEISGNKIGRLVPPAQTASPALAVSPATNIVASGTQYGPFSPPYFQYQLSTTSGSINYTITNVPSWLTASSTSGTATTTPTVITFTYSNDSFNLATGTYTGNINFNNTTNSLGDATRTATIAVNPAIAISGAGGGPDSVRRPSGARVPPAAPPR